LISVVSPPVLMYVSRPTPPTLQRLDLFNVLYMPLYPHHFRGGSYFPPEPTLWGLAADPSLLVGGEGEYHPDWGEGKESLRSRASEGGWVWEIRDALTPPQKSWLGRENANQRPSLEAF